MPIPANYLHDGFKLSSSGKHNCVSCIHNKEGFCKANKKFAHTVSYSQCKRAKENNKVNFDYKQITKEFLKKLMENSKMSFEEFCINLDLSYSSIRSLKTDKPLTTVQKKMYCERLNRYY
jgi:hypothetical protein